MSSRLEDTYIMGRMFRTKKSIEQHAMYDVIILDSTRTRLHVVHPIAVNILHNQLSAEEREEVNSRVSEIIQDKIAPRSFLDAVKATKDNIDILIEQLSATASQAPTATGTNTTDDDTTDDGTTDDDTTDDGTTDDDTTDDDATTTDTTTTDTTTTDTSTADDSTVRGRDVRPKQLGAPNTPTVTITRPAVLSEASPARRVREWQDDVSVGRRPPSTASSLARDVKAGAFIK
jgi:hypothetical protein